MLAPNQPLSLLQTIIVLIKRRKVCAVMWWAMRCVCEVSRMKGERRKGEKRHEGKVKLLFSLFLDLLMHISLSQILTVNESIWLFAALQTICLSVTHTNTNTHPIHSPHPPPTPSSTAINQTTFTSSPPGNQLIGRKKRIAGTRGAIATIDQA